MDLQGIDAFAAGQDGEMGRRRMVERGAPGSNLEGQLTGAVAYSQSRPEAVVPGCAVNVPIADVQRLPEAHSRDNGTASYWLS